MNLRCITIDDEPLALKQMQAYIEKTSFLEFIGGCSNGYEALDMIRQYAPDLILVDINMPELNGMDLVRTLSKDIMVIFTTAYSEYAIEGFQVDAIDYLLKPISYNDFLKAVNKAYNLYELKNAKDETVSGNQDSLFVRSEYRMIRIHFKDIKYIEGMKEYVRIHQTEGKPVMSLLSMKSLGEKLPARQFMRVHKSFIVNLDKVSIIERNRIVFDKDVYIPIGEQYKESFQQFLDENFLF